MFITILSGILGSLLGVFYGFTLVRILSYKGKTPHVLAGFYALIRIILLAILFFIILHYTTLNLIAFGTVLLLSFWLTLYKYICSIKLN